MNQVKTKKIFILQLLRINNFSNLHISKIASYRLDRPFPFSLAHSRAANLVNLRTLAVANLELNHYSHVF